MTEQAPSFVAQEASEAGTQEVQQIDHSELTGAVAKIQNGLDAKLEKIKGDGSLDETERHHQIREAWDRAANFHAELIEVYERQLEEQSAERERGVFHVGGRELQDSVRSAYSDVYDRTETAWASGEMDGITYAREEMERLWERAVRTGDRALQHAVGHLATERGMHELRDKWLATSQEKTKAWGRYVAARNKLDSFKDPHQRFLGAVTGGFSLRKPPELWS